jgi:hypothetical protein
MSLAVLDVAIGLILLYVLLSLLVTTIQEAIASLLSLRSRNLADALANLLEDPELSQHPEYRSLLADFYRHPLIRSLYRREHAPGPDTPLAVLRKLRLPSYLPSRTFAIALLDVLQRDRTAAQATGIHDVLLSAKDVIAKLPQSSLRRSLELLVADASSVAERSNDRAELICSRLEGWFNDSMARASGWYKRSAQRLSLAIGFAVAIALNASTFDVASSLWRDESVRSNLAASAAAYYAGNQARSASPAVEVERLLVLPLGWSLTTLPTNPSSWLRALCGWVVTGFAASLGAAFWFDVLGRALQIRGSGGRISALTGELQPSRGEPPPPSAPASERKSGVEAKAA